MKRQYFAYRSFLPELETMKAFRKEGIDTFAYMVSNTCNSLGTPYTPYPPVWKWNRVYDLDSFKRQTDDILGAVPDAKLICMLDLNTPAWWSRYLGAFGVRHDSYYGLGKISGSETWRKDVMAYLETVLTYAEKEYADHIVAYVLGGGGATEWHDRSHGEESVYRVTRFREWQKLHGKAPTDIPGLMRRCSCSHDFDNTYNDIATYYNGIDPTGCFSTLFPDGFGLLRTPAENADAIDYWRFINEFNAHTVAGIFTAARKMIRTEVELGAFFGYCFGTWTLFAGHLAYEEFYRSDAVDFIIAPIGREHRVGGNSSSAAIQESVRLCGKRLLQEMDQRTFTSNRKINEYCELPDPSANEVKDNSFKDATDSMELSRKFSMDPGGGIWQTERDICAGIKRDSALCLIEGQSMWWFDMWGGFYRGEKVMETFRKTREIWNRHAGETPASVAQILIVADPDNMYLLNDMNPRCGSFLNQPTISASLSGMPYKVCSFRDLEELDCSPFHLIVLCHPFQLSGQKRNLLEHKLFRDGKTVLFLYGTCIDEAGKWDESQNPEICGVPFGSSGIGKHDFRAWRALYAYRPETLSIELFRELACEAGCHAFTHLPRAVRVNERFLCIHTAWAETILVTLKQSYTVVRELYTGLTFRNTDHFELKTDGTETFLFVLEKKEP